ncbi:MAG TPA: YchJ family metal-binding protein [Candidatus Acidoferrum sp.]|nr:YchJ family metal-binding protein [Candidatus Acidoferrum sp.]
MTAPTLCPCGSGKVFADCCEPHLTMKVKPKSARAMVRARYCAYALGAGNNREFLYSTWHPATSQRLTLADLTNDNLQWTGLDIIRAEQKGDRAVVEFKASYHDVSGKPFVHHEISVFERARGVWLYVNGQTLGG